MQKQQPVVKARFLTFFSVLFLLAQFNASAQGFSAGLYNSYKGFGFSIDYNANEDIYNSFTIYGDMTGIFDAKYSDPGLKLIYLHYNKLNGVDVAGTRLDLFLGPGASSGFVRDYNTDSFGVVLTADIALAIRASYEHNFELELGVVTELGFFANNAGTGVNISIYGNGIRQTFLPSIKIMYRF